MPQYSIDKAVSLGPYKVSGFWLKVLPAEVFTSKVLEQKPLDCHSCHGIKHMGYSKKVKCCTHFPRVPNFLLGLALMSPPAKNGLESLFSKRLLLPEGLLPPPSRQERSFRNYKDKKWGLAEDSACDLLQGGLCEIHSFRNSVCSTWFCHYGEDKAAEAWWNKLRDIIHHAEIVIARWAMEQAGIDLDRYDRTFSMYGRDIESLSCNKTGAYQKAFYEEIWQGKDEKSFLTACGEFVLLYEDDLSRLIRNLKAPSKTLYEKNLEDWLIQKVGKVAKEAFYKTVKYKTFEELVQDLRGLEENVLFERELRSLREKT